MNKTSSLLFALTFLAAGCNTPKLSQTISSFGGVTQDTLRMERDLLDHAPYTIPANKTKLYLQDPTHYGIHNKGEHENDYQNTPSTEVFSREIPTEIELEIGGKVLLLRANNPDSVMVKENTP